MVHSGGGVPGEGPLALRLIDVYPFDPPEPATVVIEPVTVYVSVTHGEGFATTRVPETLFDTVVIVHVPL